MEHDERMKKEKLHREDEGKRKRNEISLECSIHCPHGDAECTRYDQASPPTIVKL